MKKFLVFVFSISCFMGLAACDPPSRANDINAKVFNLENDFKENYQLWVDMKADGATPYKEYALDLKTVGHQFESIGKNARNSNIAQFLSEEDKRIYANYQMLGKKIYELGYALYYGKQDQAQNLYKEIAILEEEWKE